MRKFPLILIVLITLALFITLSPSQTIAESTNPRYTKSKLDYKINENLSIQAKLEFRVKNPESSNYCWNYSGTWPIPSSEVSDIQFQSSPKNSVNFQKLQKSESTVIEIDYKICPGEEFHYSISYNAKGLIKKNGPKLQLITNLGKIKLGEDDWTRENYQINVEGPQSTELFTYEPDEARVKGENIYFSKKLSPSQSFEGIRGNWFKSPAYFEITLEEKLSNPNPDKKTKDVRYDIYLYNRNNNWQYPTLLNNPSELDTLYLAKEKENNWHANLEFGTIEPEENKDTELKLIHEIQVHDPDLDENDVGKVSNLSDKFEPFLKPRKSWEVDNPTLQSVAKTVVDNEKNGYLIAKKIIKFVNERLKYEIQTERLGALKTYQTKTGDCSEYTDLSITLARASGLPARASYGWGYSDNKLVGHAWPEFYFPGVGWKPADPTWIDTEGRIEPGGIRPGSDFPPGRGGRFAPATSGSLESYLGRLDSIHVLRNLKWLDSSESYGRYYYNGAAPEVVEGLEAEVLSIDEAADRFLQAARLSENRASELLDGGDEDMVSELELAGEYLEKAEGAKASSNIIEFCKKSIDHSSGVIAAKSKPPGEKGGFFPIPDVSIPVLVFLTGIVCMIIVGLWYGLKVK